MEIINSDYWKEAMRSCSISKAGVTSTHVLNTPMRMLIRKYPDIAKTVLDRCYKEIDKTKVMPKKNTDKSEFVEMNFEFIEDTYHFKLVTMKEGKEVASGNMGIDKMVNKITKDGLEYKYKHYSKENSSKAEKMSGFGKPYNDNNEMIRQNHPLSIMVEENNRVIIFLVA